MYSLLKKILRHTFFPLLFLVLVAAGSMLFQTNSTAQQPAAPAAPAAAPAPAPAPAPAMGDPTGGDTSGPLYSPGAVAGWSAYKDPKKPTVEELTANVAKAFYSINFVWTLVAGFLVMFMQAGFALVETGLIRYKNVSHTLAMNFMVYGVGMTGFFICGFAFMCGGANGTFLGGPGALGGIPVLDKMFTIHIGSQDYGLFGETGFFLAGRSYDAAAVVWFLFMMVFMDTTATIPTGASAERWKFGSFLIFSLFIGGLIYPVYGGWVWGGGWLAQLGVGAGLAHGAVDYAGSGVVHLQGGALALILSIMLGPRIGKFDEKGRVKPIPAHNMGMVILGTFILAFGWFGFNAGSSLAGTDGRIGIIATNTMLASASGALAAMIVYKAMFGKYDPTMMCNGMLAGLVAITAPCAFVTPWAAFFLVGGIAGVLVVLSVLFFDKIGIDDPVGAISVHGVNGAWGLLALGLLADGTYGAGWNGVGATTYLGVAGQGVTGLFYGDGKQFIVQVIDVIVCVAWNVILGGIIFWLVGMFVGGNRVTKEQELAGLDVSEMSGPAYVGFVVDAESQRN